MQVCFNQLPFVGLELDLAFLLHFRKKLAVATITNETKSITHREITAMTIIASRPISKPVSLLVLPLLSVDNIMVDAVV